MLAKEVRHPKTYYIFTKGKHEGMNLRVPFGEPVNGRRAEKNSKVLSPSLYFLKIYLFEIQLQREQDFPSSVHSANDCNTQGRAWNPR